MHLLTYMQARLGLNDVNPLLGRGHRSLSVEVLFSRQRRCQVWFSMGYRDLTVGGQRTDHRGSSEGSSLMKPLGKMLASLLAALNAIGLCLPVDVRRSKISDEDFQGGRDVEWATCRCAGPLAGLGSYPNSSRAQTSNSTLLLVESTTGAMLFRPLTPKNTSEWDRQTPGLGLP